MELNPCPLLHQWFSSFHIKVWLMSWLQCRFLGPIPPEIQFCRYEAQSRNMHNDTPPPSLGDSGRVHRGTYSEEEDFKSSRACEVCSPKRHTSTTSELLPQGHAEPHVHCIHLCCRVQDIGPFSVGAGTTDLTEGSTGVATTGQAARFLPRALQTYLCRSDRGPSQSNLVCRAGSWGHECCTDISGAPLWLGCRTLHQSHQCCWYRHMAGRVLQKCLDFHRNQQSIFHTAHLKEGEKRMR